MDRLQADDPREVGPYRLQARLGSGGMGQVFLGRSRSGRPVAVKLVRSELAGDAQFRRRFTFEVEAARLVGGFYTAPVVDSDTNADQPWLTTAYIPGPSLYDAVEKHGPLPATAISVLGAGLAEGLTAIHAHLLHRDLKPSNVILASDGPRVIDFGIARALDTTSHITSGVIGTPGFMSPEQACGGNIDTPSDVFSLGAVLAFAATGHSPFGTGRIEAVIYRIVHDEPDLTGLPAHLVDLVAACLAKNPDHRPSVTDVLNRLAEPSQTSTPWLPPHVLDVAASSAASATAATAQDHRVVRIKTLHDKCLDVLGGLPDNHTPIIQNDCQDGANQRFTLVPTGDGRHQIRTLHDKCLEVPFGWVENNVTIVQCDNYDGANQKFWIRDVGDGKVEIRTLHYKSLDVPGGLPDNISIVQYDWHGGANQQFRLEDI